MRIANTRLVTQLRIRMQKGFYVDSAYLLIDVPSGTYDEYNQPVITTSEVPIACSFTDKPKSESWQDYADIENIEAEIRFLAPTPEKGNKIKIVGHFGDLSYHDKTFEIIGIQDRGLFGCVCALKATTI